MPAHQTSAQSITACRQQAIGRIQRGFSLIELMVTLSVMGILLAVAIPNLTGFIVGNNLSSNVNTFIGLINYARSEAIVRNQSVLVCSKASATSNSCNSSIAWNQNDLQAFVDVDGSNSWSTGDVLLKTVAAVDPSDNNFRITRQGSGASYIKFGAVGLAQSAMGFTVHAVKQSDTAFEIKYGRMVCISKPGRTRVVANVGSACPNN